MGGSIEVKSIQGEGTTFFVRLDLKLVEEEKEADQALLAAEAGEEKEKDPGFLKGRRIMLVEDNELNREIAYELLSESGLIVDVAENGQEAIKLLERVGLADRKDSWPHELSGGQRQRVAICRALILHPEVLLFDEVTAALDPEMVREVLDVMLELADSGQTMLIVTHEMQFARAIADQVILLEDGGIVEQSDNAERFFTNPATERAKQFLRTFEFDRHRRSADQSE